MKNIIENPFLGEEWLPVAQVLLALHNKRFGDDVSIHAYSSQYKRIDGKRGPTIKVIYLSNGDVLMTAFANADLSKTLTLEQYQAMEFMDFRVPKNEDDEITTDPSEMSESCNKKFVRVFRDDEKPEDFVELTLQLLSVIYEIEPGASGTNYFFGSRLGQHEFVHSLDVLERYAASGNNNKAAIFGIKGSHPYNLMYEDKEGSLND
jgi:hypothetical protein